jgi:hypothetical protein
MFFIIKILENTNKHVIRNPLYLGMMMVALYITFRYIGWSDTYVEFHDNLDGTFVNWSLLYSQNISYFNPSSEIVNIANGVKIGNVFAGVSIGELMFMAFEPILAYALNETIARIVAFIGMFLLLDSYFLINPRDRAIAFWVAVSFSLLPFNPSPFLTIAGQPLLLFAFLNILNNKKQTYNWLIFLVFPFYSSFPLAGFALCLLFGLIWVSFSWSRKKINIPGLLALAILLSLYLVSIYKLIYLYFLDESFLSIRSLWPTHEMLSIIGMMENLLNNFLSNLFSSFSIFLFGQEHAPSLHTYFILGSVIVALVVPSRHYYERNAKIKVLKIIIICFFISIFYGFWHDLIRVLPGDNIFIKSFRWSRIHWIHPMLWYIVFFMSLSFIYGSNSFFNKKRISLKFHQYFLMFMSCIFAILYFYYIDSVVIKYELVYPDIVSMLKIVPISISIFCIILSLYIGFLKDSIEKFLKNHKSIDTLITNPRVLIVFLLLSGQIIYNLNPLKFGKVFVYDGIKASQHHGGLKNTTFSDFFLEDTFQEITDYIDMPQKDYRVISIGFTPSIALYNGFYTLDMYLSSYSLDYKSNFRTIIEKELEKDINIKKYFDDTGKRCYLFTSALGKNWYYRKHEFPKTISVDLNIDQFKNMGGQFIFSAVEIDNYEQNSLLFHKLFESSDSKKLNIYLYEATKFL